MSDPYVLDDIYGPEPDDEPLSHEAWEALTPLADQLHAQLVAANPGWEDLVGGDIAKHQPGSHDQKSHGHRGKGRGGDDGPGDLKVATTAVRLLHQQGGYTIKRGTGFIPKSGWMCAIDGQEETVGSVEALTPRMVQDYMERHSALLDKSANYLGGWVSNGVVYLDVSHRFTGPDAAGKAVRSGFDNNQLAVLDLSTFDEVFMDRASGFPGTSIGKAARPKAVRFLLDKHQSPEVLVADIKRFHRATQ